MQKLPRPEPITGLTFWLAILLLSFAPTAFAVEKVVLHLKNGDRLSGVVVAETNNMLVISNTWSQTLAIPLDQIGQREIFLADAVTNAAATNASPKIAAAKPAPVTPPKPAAQWRGEARVGLDLIYGAKERQIYHGRLKLEYVRPYESNPKKVFRNLFDYSAEYGKTDGEKSSDRMIATDKTSFDFHERWYAYNLAGVGYDDIKKVRLQYEEGPGVGYHLFTYPDFIMNVEAGANYQVQLRKGGREDSRDFFFRLAEDFSVKFGARTRLIEKLEFFPRVDLTQFRLRFESTLSYDLWKNIALNLTVLDLYDSNPTSKVPHNELQIRSSLGVKF